MGAVDDRPVMTPAMALPGWEAYEDADSQRDWWEQLWEQAVLLNGRYRLGLRAGWWENPIHTELLATLAAWVGLFDSGAWTDPPSKLQLLLKLDRIRGLLRDGDSAFAPQRHRDQFTAYLTSIGCGHAQAS